ncbi:tryptophan 2,3-dioxygenase [Endozoicomonas montiporae]|uniref:Tryptophan 2,3-dioxygenase n=3 Tax=Endozoicomonas montiporae TaxID=1027273 RepID=A0A081N1S9_9GAMM|nr:tryptophan 2,3-dioxygenase family protein [Endozoicomonas montiporae]AMO58656.1 tryptophan 2 3-dioxygenase [Endozoicomonas montiporae CL-33]KEQ12402.1 tryptophan 2,3-dioxygenase [Endozoicomonas montiporae]
MNRADFYGLMEGKSDLDYEIYLNTHTLLTAQKSFDALCNQDELMFQIVHQVEELWMKLIAYSLLNINEYIEQTETFRVLTLFGRVSRILRLMTQQLDVLETMSPKEYQQIRLQLGNGSGQESPGFRTLLKMPEHLWKSYKEQYLDKRGLSVETVYNSEYAHDDAYVIAEALTEFDELFQTFRIHHLLLIQRSIGGNAKSLKGRSVTLLEQGARHHFFPELWEIRSRMTDEWGGEYGVKRDKIQSEPKG